MMEISKVACVYFSPTGSTQALAETIARGIGGDCVELIDITRRAQRLDHPLSFEREVLIFAAPVYYGRVPEEVAACLSTYSGNRNPAVLLAVYGNRAFDDALRELRDIAKARNFIPVAAGAFPAEHSYSTPQCPIAPNRPDSEDFRQASAFGMAVRGKLLSLKPAVELSPITVPGNTPYVEPTNLLRIRHLRATTPLAFTPETDMAECTHCGVCAEVCPMDAISPDDPVITDKERCLLCFACVKRCPVGARQMNMPEFTVAISELAKRCQQRKEPELFL